jgi:hypothetical protein
MNHYHPMYYPYYGGYYAYPYYPWPYAGMGCHPMGHTAPLTHMKLPLEILVDATTTSQSSFIGGLEDAKLSLEYLKTGTSASLKVSVTQAGTTTVTDVTPLADDYQIKENFLTVSPGATVTLDVIDCTARLRWCEIICC